MNEKRTGARRLRAGLKERLGRSKDEKTLQNAGTCSHLYELRREVFARLEMENRRPMFPFPPLGIIPTGICGCE